MSMLSSKCDGLRNAADELDERAKAYPSGHNVISPMLRDAADTILELRNKLAGVVDQQDEIERLRSCLSDDAENARQIMAENAKLREVIDDITEVVEVSDPSLVEFIAKRMQRVRIEVTDD